VDGEPILHLDYAPGALISRINKGLRRRRKKSLLGFFINTSNGRWTKGEDEAEDGEVDPESPASQRIVPIVQDNKNAALLRLPGYRLSEIAATTLQHALLRGLELTFQLEEGETYTEPVPSREKRNAILVYEATEGGAGVLSRIVQEPGKLAETALAALELMHFENVENAIAAQDPSLLTTNSEARCVKGCYRCLLSYYNQPDHELIDRTDPDACRLLLRLAAATVELSESKAPRPPGIGIWLQAIEGWRFPPPSSEPLVIDEVSIPLVWRDHRVAAVPEDFPSGTRSKLESMGFTVFILPKEIPSEPPAQLAELLGDLV
jgi:hypothetical protein